jgi:nifR3 family TIM-barrel protein
LPEIRNDEAVVLGNRVFLAPMAGIADAAMRVVARVLGAGPLFTEMISAHGVACGRHRLVAEQLALLEWQRPVAVQLVGSDPAKMAEAARVAAALGADTVNVNLACPARKIAGHGKGAALLRDLGLAARVVAAVVRAVCLPVTVKMRSGWDRASVNAVEAARVVEGAGAAAIFFHPRTREQQFGGAADWSLVPRVKAAVAIPVVGNGDVKSAADAERVLREYPCDGVMVGRGALGRPWLLGEIRGRASACGLLPAGIAAPVPDLSAVKEAVALDRLRLAAGERQELGKLVRLHVALAAGMYPERVLAKKIRSHLAWYSRGLAGCAQFRAGLSGLCDRAAIDDVVGEFFFGRQKEGTAGTAGTEGRRA